MKKIFVLVFAFTVASSAFSQNKKELVERITQLETTIEELKGSVEKLQGNLKLLNDANSLLEKQVKFQEDVNSSQSETIKQLQKDLDEAKRVSVAADPTAIITDPRNEEDSIISLVQHYWGAKRWENRLPLLYTPEKVKPMMAKYYANGMTRKVVDKNTIAIPGSGYKVGDKFVVDVCSTGRTMSIRKTLEGFKIDWIATIGYDEESLANYINRQGTEKNVVHFYLTYCKVDTYWDNYGLGEKYYDCGDVYVLKSSPVGQRMAQIMKENTSPRGKEIVVEVQGKTLRNEYGNEKYFVFVNRIVKEDWFSD